MQLYLHSRIRLHGVVLNLAHNNVSLYPERPTFFGKGPQTLLWAGSRAPSVTIIISGIPIRLLYCVIFIVYA
jgi:hypothetical protein